jgi:ATP-dependent Clp protease protease subunit
VGRRRRKTLSQALNGITAPTIHLHINSPGGDVFEARAMAAAIARTSRKSSRTSTAWRPRRRPTSRSRPTRWKWSTALFHDPSRRGRSRIGNADELRQASDLLDKIDDSIAADYMRKTGKSKSELLALMAAETWYSADEAKAAGFADRIAGAAPKRRRRRKIACSGTSRRTSQRAEDAARSGAAQAEAEPTLRPRARSSAASRCTKQQRIAA